MTRKAEKKAEKKAGKDAAKESKDAVKRARTAVGVAKVVGPAVVPVLTPYAARAAGVARETYDRYRARQLGVPVTRLGEFTGRGAALHARIAGVADGLADLRKAQRATADDQAFADQAQGTLEQLTASVRAAERMPAARRKAAHRAVAGELERLESQLLHRLGI
ncbi:DUF6474 family protein [Amycolatopsis cihanbeyliensis]|uniref:Uncharacterized protein n=1 Tax=Amycolatopsis cihanbeyliensis TaxID=1128664 RepID=A0A542DLP9_AMYCI|nr:hypothetical protein FB471_3775 [Amycolatopsis cihanbeyliensis]